MDVDPVSSSAAQNGGNGQSTNFNDAIQGLLQHQHQAFVDEQFTDCEVHVGEEPEIIKAHRVFLCMHSGVFAAYFQNDSVEARTSIVKIEDLDPALVKSMISFMYNGRVDDLPNIAHDLYVVADRYDVKLLQKLCIDWMFANLSVDHIFRCLELAFQLNLEDLKKKAIDFAADNFGTLRTMEEWRTLPERNGEIVIAIMDVLDERRNRAEQELQAYRERPEPAGPSNRRADFGFGQREEWRGVQFDPLGAPHYEETRMEGRLTDLNRRLGELAIRARFYEEHRNEMGREAAANALDRRRAEVEEEMAALRRERAQLERQLDEWRQNARARRAAAAAAEPPRFHDGEQQRRRVYGQPPFGFHPLGPGWHPAPPPRAGAAAQHGERAGEPAPPFAPPRRLGFDDWNNDDWGLRFADGIWRDEEAAAPRAQHAPQQQQPNEERAGGGGGDADDPQIVRVVGAPHENLLVRHIQRRADEQRRRAAGVRRRPAQPRDVRRRQRMHDLLQRREIELELLEAFEAGERGAENGGAMGRAVIVVDGDGRAANQDADAQAAPPAPSAGAQNNEPAAREPLEIMNDDGNAVEVVIDMEGGEPRAAEAADEALVEIMGDDEDHRHRN